jgi:type I restriction enzyme S subunit
MEKQKGKKPQIRFPEFKNVWEHKRLNELLYEAKLRNGNLKYGKDKVLSVSGELGVINQIEHLGRSYAGVSVHQYHVVEYGDIVYTKSPLKANPFGIIKLNKGEAGIVSTLYAVYKVNSKTAFGSFVDYYFSLDANTNRYLRPLVKKGAKNDMKVNNTYVLNDRIFIPELSEQKKIASFLSAIDEKIGQLSYKKELMEQYKKGVMQQLFSGKLRFKDENGKAYPKWEEKQMGDLGDFRGGGTPNTKIERHWSGKIPWISSSDIIENDIHNININRFINNEAIAESATKLIPKGSIMLVSRVGVGKLAINKVELCTSQDFTNFIPKKCNSYFLGYLLLAQKNILVNLAQGTSIKGFTTFDLKSLRLKIPNLDEQQKIANFLTSIDAKIESVIVQISQTQTFKKGLLQQMFV